MSNRYRALDSKIRSSKTLVLWMSKKTVFKHVVIYYLIHQNYQCEKNVDKIGSYNIFVVSSL